MDNSPTISRRSYLLAGGLVASGGVIGVNSWTPTRERVYESTSRSPEQRNRVNQSPILDGEPSLTGTVPRAEAFVYQSTDEAENKIDWDKLLPPETSEPYRSISSGEFLSVVVAVLPVASRLVDQGPHDVSDSTVHHSVGVRDRSNELTLPTDEEAPVRRYMLHKWTLNLRSPPTNAKVQFVAD